MDRSGVGYQFWAGQKFLQDPLQTGTQNESQNQAGNNPWSASP